MEPETNSEPQFEGAQSETPKKKNKTLTAIASLLLLALLGGAAYMAGRYLNAGTAAGPGRAGGPGAGLTVRGDALSAAGDEVSYTLDIKPAPELPSTPPDANGIFTKREDNSIYIGTGQITFAIRRDGSGGPGDASSSYDGPVVEIVVTNATKVYQDVTMSSSSPEELPSGGSVQQKVAPGSVEEIGQNSHVTAWGKKVGDRIIADVLVYSSPMILKMGGE
jgi:hypothetical protein